MPEPVRVACVGAGERALAAHYPCLRRLADAGEIEVVGISELDSARLDRGASILGVAPPQCYAGLDHLLAATRPTLVYAIMGPTAVRAVAEQALAAGAHVVVEKPPGANLADTVALANAARAAGRHGMVTFQRRWAAVTQAARQRILDRGPVTTCVVEFHKDLREMPTPPWGVSNLWEDIVHVIDLARYLCGGAVVAVHGYRDAIATAWPNVYTALVRFDNGATALITGNRASGGRFLRVEAHGLGIGAYMDEFPAALRLLTDNRDAEMLTGAALASSAIEADWDGLTAMHRHFIACTRTGQTPLTNFDDALTTMRLVDRIERAGTCDNSETKGTA